MLHPDSNCLLVKDIGRLIPSFLGWNAKHLHEIYLFYSHVQASCLRLSLLPAYISIPMVIFWSIMLKLCNLGPEELRCYTNSSCETGFSFAVLFQIVFFYFSQIPMGLCVAVVIGSDCLNFKTYKNLCENLTFLVFLWASTGLQLGHSPTARGFHQTNIFWSLPMPSFHLSLRYLGTQKVIAACWLILVVIVGSIFNSLSYLPCFIK